MKKTAAVIILLILIIFGVSKVISPKTQPQNTLKLYWFIPDGVRAEPGLFNIYKWAKEGKLPNIKKLMEMGSYGYSFPTFPSHTPVNFAALLTGAYPEVNGVDDGPMHAIGSPLDKVAVGGFRSVARKVPAIWKTLEDAGMKVAVLSVPGSTPPEIQKGVVIRGRWGGWGADFNAINFETKGNLLQRVLQGRAVHLFFFGAELTKYIDSVSPSGWVNTPKSFSPPYEVKMDGWGTPVYAFVYDSTDNGKTDYDHVLFSLDKKDVLADLTPGKWSGWLPITLHWVTTDKDIPVDTHFKATVIKLGSDKFFRIRIDYDNLNQYIAQPPEAASAMENSVGPMIDFADNFPAQLVYYPEDKKTFMDEADMSFEWHTKAVSAMVKDFSPNVVIQDIYTPNQMLTSRWWMGYVDPKSIHYKDISDKEREKLWGEVRGMYKKLDNIVGEILKVSGKNTVIVFSSDHGAVPLNRNVNLNNLFAQKGWLKFTIDPKTGEPNIDWKNSKVIYLKMAHVYINPNGLAGDYHRASGPEYEYLRNQVIDALENLKDEDGSKPVAEVVKWEDAKRFMQLDPSRIGDLVIANAPGYGWNEEMSNDLKVFTSPLITGYKQAILAKDDPGMWTPFIIAGPGIKKNNFLGDTPAVQIDQYPTIMKALKVKIPDFVQGKPLDVFN
ncbi:alkaline phosphatase family protein [Patescibacteria group bacterium]|nr:alkaline phosphatase family protein [Patescibacteria group bacterium]